MKVYIGHSLLQLSEETNKCRMILWFYDDETNEHYLRNFKKIFNEPKYAHIMLSELLSNYLWNLDILEDE